MKDITIYTEQDNQFYPTPESFLETIEEDFYCELKCFDNECKYNLKVLEPSAGKGDIASHLKQYGVRKTGYSPYHGVRCAVECIEIDKTLQATLRGLEFPVVYDDFLSFETHTIYDLIYMNPPFENGDVHLLKAISLQERYGGRILCILNAQTLKNPCTRKRMELIDKLDKYGAKIKYYDGAFCAYDAERISGVETAVVWIDIPAPESLFNSKVFETLDKAAEIHIEKEETQAQKELIRMGLDWITSVVQQYNAHIQAALAFFKEYAAFDSVYKSRFAGIEGGLYEKPFSLKIYGKDDYDLNLYIQKTRRLYWKTLFDNPKFSGRLTTRLQNELSARLDEMAHYDFNEHNILSLMEENMRATAKGIEAEILALFDKFTKHAQYDGCDNVHYYNGWKTNSAYKLNSKIIIPFYSAWKSSPNYVYHGTGYGGYCTKKGYVYELNERETIYTLTDMAKTLNYLANGVCGLEDMETLGAIITRNFERGNAKNIETEHFILTFYKKGTCHLKFRNQELLDKFNLFASQRKGWLPPSYGKKAYGEMDEEEQTLVKEFSGSEENYNKIFYNQQNYLVENKELLQIGTAEIGV